MKTKPWFGTTFTTSSEEMQQDLFWQPLEPKWDHYYTVDTEQCSLIMKIRQSILDTSVVARAHHGL